MNTINKNYTELTNAIVKQAADDYTSIKLRLHKYKNVKEKATYVDQLEYELRKIIRFFKSDWYRTLCELDCEFLIQKLDERVDILIAKGKKRWRRSFIYARKKHTPL